MKCKECIKTTIFIVVGVMLLLFFVSQLDGCKKKIDKVLMYPLTIGETK